MHYGTPDKMDAAYDGLSPISSVVGIAAGGHVLQCDALSAQALSPCGLLNSMNHVRPSVSQSISLFV